MTIWKKDVSMRFVQFNLFINETSCLHSLSIRPISTIFIYQSAAHCVPAPLIQTLKRWEEAERQRRKALRDSNRTSTSQRNSLVGDVSRRASKLWKDGAQRRSSLRRGATRIRDDDSPSHRSSTGTSRVSTGTTREDGPAPSRSTTLSTQDREGRSVSPSSPTPLVSNNPFSTPRMGSPVSLEDRYGSRSKSPAPGAGPEDALMQGTSAPPTPSANRTMHDPEFPDRPILQASGSYSLEAPSADSAKPKPKRSSLPPPRPLDLPEEVTASPTAAAANMPRTVSPMLIERSQADIIEDEELERREASQGRWWTDWLCGCRESGRLGQDQVRYHDFSFSTSY